MDNIFEYARRAKKYNCSHLIIAGDMTYCFNEVIYDDNKLEIEGIHGGYILGPDIKIGNVVISTPYQVIRLILE